MSRGIDLIKNTGILFIARTSTQMVSFFMLPLYTALMTTEQYGQLDIYSSLVLILLPLISLQLEQAIFRFLVGQSKEEYIKGIISSAMVALLMSAAIVGMIYIVCSFIFRFEYSIPLFFYYGMMLCSTVMYQVCRGFGKNTVYGFATFLISFITVSLNIIFVACFHMGVGGVLISTAIAHAIGSLYMVRRTKVFHYFEIGAVSVEQIKELLVYSLPLIFNQISSWTINYSDRMIILVFLGMGVNGIYSVANKFSNILNIFFNVFNLAWTENVVKNISDPDAPQYAKKIITLTAQIYISLVAGIMNLLPFVFSFFVNEKYKEAYYHVPILLVAIVFSGLSASFGSVYIAFKKTKNVGITTFLAGIVNVVVHLALINRVGLYAASISTLVSFIALFIYRYIFIQEFFLVKLNFKNMILISGVLVFAVTAYYIRNPYLLIFALVVNLTNITLIAKDNMRELRKMLKR